MQFMLQVQLALQAICPPHLTAIARHMGIDLNIDSWEKLGHDIPLLVNCQPAWRIFNGRFF